MKLFIVCSKHFYNRIPDIAVQLTGLEHELTMPNSFDEPFREERMRELGPEEHSAWKREMMKLHEPKIRANEGVLVLNFEKNGQPNYIGGGTFMEVVKAWELEKRIFLYNDIPDNIFRDELLGINPTVIYGDLTKIK